MPKTLTGLALIALGGASTLVPGVGEAVAPWLCKAGFLWVSFGAGEKRGRVQEGGDPLKNEKKLVRRIEGK